MQQCSVQGCGKLVVARGWCRNHYAVWYRRGGHPAEDRRTSEFRPRGVCTFTNCGELQYAKELCKSHYMSARRKGQTKSGIDKGPWKRTCDRCGKTFDSRYQSRATFCSRECKGKARIASGESAKSVRKYQFKTKYRLTLEDYEQLRDSQGGGCAICKRTEPVGRVSKFGPDYWLHVDHDHKTGRVRGLLCGECNTGIGKLQDDPELLRRAASYLVANGSPPSGP